MKKKVIAVLENIKDEIDASQCNKYFDEKGNKLDDIVMVTYRSDDIEDIKNNINNVIKMIQN